MLSDFDRPRIAEPVSTNVEQFDVADDRPQEGHQYEHQGASDAHRRLQSTDQFASDGSQE